jgi:hypothetical protein
MVAARFSDAFLAYAPSFALLFVLASYPWLGKPAVAIYLALIGLACAAIGVRVFFGGVFRLPPLAWAPAPLLCIALVSFLAHESSTQVVFGTTSEWGTLASYALLLAASLFGALTPPGRRSVLLLVATTVVALGAFFSGAHEVFGKDGAVRPSRVATALVAEPEYSSSLTNALIGTGPRSFPEVWNRNRTAEFNAGPLWDATPDTGYSTLATTAVELGILGILAFLLIPAAALAVIITGVGSPRLLLFSAVGAVVIYGTAAVYPLDVPLLALGAALLGMVGTARPLIGAPGMSPYVAGVALLLIGVACTYVGTRQSLAAFSHAKTYAAVHEGDVHRAEVQARRAAELWKVPDYEMRSSQLILENSLAMILRTSGQVDEDLVRSQFDWASTYAGRASKRDERSYRARLNEASINITLLRFGYPRASESAEAALMAAERLAPTRPDTHYMWAMLEAARGNEAAAMSRLGAALKLKPDYEEAANLMAAFRFR